LHYIVYINAFVGHICILMSSNDAIL